MAQVNESKMTMSDTRKPCEKWGSLLSQYVDETLDARRIEDVQRHVRDCAACASALAAFQATRDALRSIDPIRLSSDFDRRLAERIASIDMQRNAARRPALWFPAALRIGYGLALAAATLVVVSVVNTPHPRKPRIATASDAALVTQCLAQHRSYAATQPLTDWSAQNLSARTDSQTAQPNDILGTDSGTDSL